MRVFEAKLPLKLAAAFRVAQTTIVAINRESVGKKYLQAQLKRVSKVVTRRHRTA